MLVELSDRVAAATAQDACRFLTAGNRPPPRLQFRWIWANEMIDEYTQGRRGKDY